MARSRGFLFDTNAFLFVVSRSDRLAADRIAAIGEAARWVSQVCAIEIAIKQGLGKLALPPPFQTSFAHAIDEAVWGVGADLLPVEIAHIETLSHLPLHHRDPFDRLIIAQALSENLTVVTRDRAFALYPGLNVYEI
jgi:PIN domain nuclease of toxin-antitoxin system